MKTNPNDPISYNMVDADGQLHGGLTKREYFASLNMQAHLSSICTGDESKRLHVVAKKFNMAPYQYVAKCAIEAADRLIEELNK